MNPPQIFDSLAEQYDDSFTRSTIAQYLRGIVQARLERHFMSGMQVLELGCGTGEDALWLANRGVSVIATDVSEGMLAATRTKCQHQPLIQIERLDLRALPAPHPSDALLDGIFSNFGPVNCLQEWDTLAAWSAQRVNTGGIVALGVMSPACLWEPVWHGLHGNFKTATRRWRQNALFTLPENTHPIPINYPSIRRLTKAFSPHFTLRFVRGIGLFLPPSDVYGMIEKRPHLMRLLLRLEERFGGIKQLALLADHYWIEFERR